MHDFFITLLKPEHLLLYLFAYGVAATPTSYLVARFIHGVDFNGDVKATHTARYVYHSLSKWSGVLVFCVDCVKGLLPCAIGWSLQVPLEILAVIGFFAVLGHCFSIWLRFAGGHGGVTAASALLVVHWPSALVILMANILFILLGASAGVASIVAVLVGACVLFWALANKVVVAVVAAMAAVIIARHWS